jgi:hypothetical protein
MKGKVKVWAAIMLLALMAGCMPPPKWAAAGQRDGIMGPRDLAFAQGALNGAGYRHLKVTSGAFLLRGYGAKCTLHYQATAAGPEGLYCGAMGPNAPCTTRRPRRGRRGSTRCRSGWRGNPAIRR